MVNDGLGALDVAKALTPVLKHVLRGFRLQAPDIDISLAAVVLKGTVQRLQG